MLLHILLCQIERKSSHRVSRVKTINGEVSGSPSLVSRGSHGQRLPPTTGWLPPQAALGLSEQAVEVQRVVLAFGGGGIKVV